MALRGLSKQQTFLIRWSNVTWLVSVLPLVVIRSSNYLLPSPWQSAVYHAQRLHSTTFRLQTTGAPHASGTQGRHCWKTYRIGFLTLANPLSTRYLGWLVSENPRLRKRWRRDHTTSVHWVLHFSSREAKLTVEAPRNSLLQSRINYAYMINNFPRPLGMC